MNTPPAATSREARSGLDPWDRAELPAAPTPQGFGWLKAVGPGGRRQTLSLALVTAESGVPGDAWGRQAHAEPEAQLAVMQVDVAELVANGQSLTLFGDNLFFDLDLSAANLPAGSRLRTGTATLEVTSEPHDGCRKFCERFGGAALRLVSRGDLKHLNLRGVYMQVVEDGAIATGDPVQLLPRPPDRRDA